MDENIEAVLWKLDSSRVVDFSETFKGLQVGECCDNWFSVILNKDEVGYLIEYLKRVHSRMS